MAGYQGFSKSNNAVDAEANNCFPASILAKKLRVKTAAIQAVLTPSEWHHTSKHFNATDYYDGALLLEIAASDTPDDFDDDEYAEAKEQLAALLAWKAPKQDVQVYEDCTVKWLVWSGSRNHPKATEKTVEHCAVEWKGGAFCLVTFADGGTMRKKTDACGFEVRQEGGSRVWF